MVSSILWIGAAIRGKGKVGLRRLPGKSHSLNAILRRRAGMSSIIVCKTRLLTPEQAKTALRRGIEVNPANAPGTSPAFREDNQRGRRGGRRLALLTQRRWPAS